MIDYFTIDCAPLGMNLLEATEKYGFSEEPTESCFNFVTGSKRTLFEEWNNDPIHGPRFARAMSAIQSTSAYNVSYLVN